MNSEILQKLSSVIATLNNIEVKGRQNLLNLYGAIAALEEIGNDIYKTEAERDKHPAPLDKEEG